MVYLLLPAPIIMSIHYVFADGITAMGYQKLRAYMSIITAVLNAVLGLVFIPMYGVAGAVGITLFSETLLLVLFSSVYMSKLKKNMLNIKISWWGIYVITAFVLGCIKINIGNGDIYFIDLFSAMTFFM
ncbi:polysaccharide biosynthesis C-terminal domain-containing protein [Serratia ureilytica]